MEFCPNCEVAMDMHDEPDDCEGAVLRADMLERMERMMFGGLVH